MALRDKKTVLGWSLFDYANSSYSAVISAVVFPVYYASYIVGNESGRGDLWWGSAVSLSMAVVALSSPFLGGLADFGGIRKRLLFIYTAVCVLSVASFTLLGPGAALLGFILVVLANVGLEGGLVFYNSYLPDIAEREYQGRVSSWGFALGYAGSITSLLIVLPLVKGGHYSAVWLVVAVFFALFSIPAFIFLPPDRRRDGVFFGGAAKEGLRYTWKTLKEIWGTKGGPRRFLLAFFIYEDGVNTVIVFSSIYAARTLGFGAGELVGMYLAVQVTALLGAAVMARPVDVWGPKKVITGSLVLWTAVSVSAYFIVDKAAFWAVASAAGLGLGTVQAASRAFFAQFVPTGHESEYFGVYSLMGKSSAILGPLVFGVLSTTFGSQRPAILAISLFFIAGLAILWTVKGGGPNVGGGAHAQL